MISLVRNPSQVRAVAGLDCFDARGNTLPPGESSSNRRHPDNRPEDRQGNSKSGDDFKACCRAHSSGLSQELFLAREKHVRI